ncbi:hypothetical protein [Blastopirellula marina]|nr:hypothetical protein [Blastopirellula marina]
MARDLKPMVRAIAKIPVEPARVVELACEMYPEASLDPNDEGHTTFWLVLADQLYNWRVDAREAFERAIAIVDSGVDIQLPLHQEMGPADVRKREKSLQKLREKLVQPIDGVRKTLAAPEKLTMELGDIIVFPLAKGMIVVPGKDAMGTLNPYWSRALTARFGKQEQQDWGAAVLVKCELIFGFLASYCPIILDRRLYLDEKPTREMLLAHQGWDLTMPGTCSSAHFKRLQIEKVGRIKIDPDVIEQKFPSMYGLRNAAVKDISICESLYIGRRKPHNFESIQSLSEITLS